MAFNSADIRCALAHFGSDRPLAARDRQPPDLIGQVNTFGWQPPWRPGPRLTGCSPRHPYLQGNRQLVARVLAERLPQVHYSPQAGYLSWLDCRPPGAGADPAQAVLERARLELCHGPDFGPVGKASPA